MKAIGHLKYPGKDTTEKYAVLFGNQPEARIAYAAAWKPADIAVIPQGTTNRDSPHMGRDQVVFPVLVAAW